MLLRRFGPTALKVVALLGVLQLLAWNVLWALEHSIGFDYMAYDAAARRLLAGQPIYDPHYSEIGGFLLFTYPPPFAVMTVPFALLPLDLARVAFCAVAFALLLVTVRLLPVRPGVRWAILALGAWSWPWFRVTTLGQVGPILMLLFTLGWRWLDRPWRLGATIAFGTVVKVQPIVLLGWAVATGRRRAAAAGVVGLAGIALITTAVTGVGAWGDQAALLSRLALPITTPKNLTPGHLAFLSGASLDLAGAIQLVNVAAVAAVVLVAVWRGSALGSYLTVVVGVHLAAPILWEHYAAVLLLPVAWMLDRGRIWTAAIPLATAAPLWWLLPAGVYTAAFWVALVAVAWEAIGDRRESEAATRPSAAVSPAPEPAVSASA